jgi:hypothetical protein
MEFIEIGILVLQSVIILCSAVLPIIYLGYKMDKVLLENEE